MRTEIKSQSIDTAETSVSEKLTKHLTIFLPKTSIDLLINAEVSVYNYRSIKLLPFDVK